MIKILQNLEYYLRSQNLSKEADSLSMIIKESRRKTLRPSWIDRPLGSINEISAEDFRKMKEQERQSNALSEDLEVAEANAYFKINKNIGDAKKGDRNVKIMTASDAETYIKEIRSLIKKLYQTYDKYYAEYKSMTEKYNFQDFDASRKISDDIKNKYSELWETLFHTRDSIGDIVTICTGKMARDSEKDIEKYRSKFTSPNYNPLKDMEENAFSQRNSTVKEVREKFVRLNERFKIPFKLTKDPVAVKAEQKAVKEKQRQEYLKSPEYKALVEKEKQQEEVERGDGFYRVSPIKREKPWKKMDPVAKYVEYVCNTNIVGGVEIGETLGQAAHPGGSGQACANGPGPVEAEVRTEPPYEGEQDAIDYNTRIEIYLDDRLKDFDKERDEMAYIVICGPDGKSGTNPNNKICKKYYWDSKTNTVQPKSSKQASYSIKSLYLEATRKTAFDGASRMIPGGVGEETEAAKKRYEKQNYYLEENKRLNRLNRGNQRWMFDQGSQEWRFQTLEDMQILEEESQRARRKRKYGKEDPTLEEMILKDVENLPQAAKAIKDSGEKKVYDFIKWMKRTGKLKGAEFRGYLVSLNPKYLMNALDDYKLGLDPGRKDRDQEFI